MAVFEIPVSALLIIAIAVAAILVYVPFLAVGYARAVAGYDTAAPRAMVEQLPDWGKRATWAHQNSWESFGLFTAAALMAYATGVSSPTARWAVLAYLAARLLFSVFYIANIPLLRSLMFAIGSLSIGVLMVQSIQMVLAR
jgi:uncharacterized MAPEG superfamily protein